MGGAGMAGTFIVEDSRQRAGKHAGKHGYWAGHGVPFLPRARALPFGDYMCGFADGTLDEASKVSVDTKASMGELASNLGKKRSRETFLREVGRANQAGCGLVVLVEDGGVTCIEDVHCWVNPCCKNCFQYGLGCDPRAAGACPKHGTMKPVQGEVLAAQMASIQRGWDARFEFASSPSGAARRICEILGVLA